MREVDARQWRRVRDAARALLPGLGDYRMVPRTWRGDLTAGVTVGIVALPLALGFAASAGLPPEAGLVTAIVAGVLAAVFGGSDVQVSGPTGAMVVVLGPIVAAHGVGAVGAVTVMAGVLVVAAGALRLGRAVSFIPWPVIEGFTLGIAIIIFAQQIPFLASGASAHGAEQPANAVLAAVRAVLTADPAYLAWSAGAVAIVAVLMIVAPRIHPAIPGSLLGILVVTVITLLIPTPLATIGALPAAIPMPALPSLEPETISALAPAALAVAALAAIESLLSARVAGSLADTGRFDPDRELIGQGVASIGSALVGGMPATGAIARTAVNVRAGGRSRLAAIVHAAVLGAILLAAAEPVGRLPMAALAAVLMVTAVRMVHRETVASILRSTRADAVSFVLTALITVSFDLIVAVLIGVVFAGFVAVRALARSSGVRRESTPAPEHAGDDRIGVIAIEGPLFFAGSQRVADELSAVDGVVVVILRMSRLELVDATGARAISEIVHAMERRGVTVLLCGVRPGHEELFRSVGVLAALRDHRHLFDDIDAAVEHARSHVQRAAAHPAD